VYLKKFLMSWTSSCPRQAQPYRVPARRFGYILQVAKERYKDESLNLGMRGREGEGADQRAPDQPGHQPQGAPGGTAG
jgi:hypothetical protein